MRTLTLPTTGEVHHPEHHGYGASVDGLLVRLAPAPDRQVVTELAPPAPNRIQTEANPQDVMPESGDVHSITDFTGGEGLLDRFRRNARPNDAIRFWRSEHIDVSPTDGDVPEHARLLPTSALIDTAGHRMDVHGETLWVTSGTTLRKTSEALAPSPGFANDDPHAGEGATTVHDVAALGEIPYVALGANGIHRDTGSWAHWSDVAALRVWGVLDRIVASTGTALYEAAAGAGSVLLYTLPDGEAWTDVTEAGEAILAAATNGFVYAFRPGEAGELTIVAQSRLESETPLAIRARQDVVLIATTDGSAARLWMAQGAGLEGLQLLRQWPGATVGGMAMGRDRLLLGLLEGGQGWVWRLELSTIGLSKGLRVGAGVPATVATVGGLEFAAVASSGVWRETEQLQPEGWLMGPLSDFYRAEDKSWTSGWLDVAVSLGEEVTLYYTTSRVALTNPDHPAWIRLRTYRSSLAGVEHTLGRVVARSLAGMVRLKRSPSNTSPTVRAMGFRSYAGPGDVLLQLPVDVGDQLERPGRRRVHTPGWGQMVLEALREKEGRAAICHLYRRNETVRGKVEQVAAPTQALTPRGSVTSVCLVTVRGRRVNPRQTIDTSGWGAWGMAVWGGMGWGGELLDEEVS